MIFLSEYHLLIFLPLFPTFTFLKGVRRILLVFSNAVLVNSDPRKTSPYVCFLFLSTEACGAKPTGKASQDVVLFA